MVRVIVVEDDADLRDSMCRYLMLVGMDCRGAGTARQLFDLHRENPAAVIVLDINLPDQSGFEVAPNLRAMTPEVGIIMLSARGQVDDRVVGLNAGADSYLVKPVSLRELEAVILSLARRVSDD